MTGRGTVLVTGAAGTVGKYVVLELLSHGYRVRATDVGKRGDYANGHFSFYDGDLTSEEFCRRVTRGVDAVIHLAALIDVGLSWEALAPINLNAVKTLYACASEAGARIFVHTSSGSIYAPTNKVRDESSRLKAVGEASPYELTKILSEATLYHARQSAKTPMANFAILRPSLIYGPQNKYLAAVYLGIAVVLHDLLGKDAPRLIGGPKTNMAHAEDVARAAIFLMEHPQTWGEAWNVADNTPYGFGSQITIMMDAFGYKTSRLVLPLPGPGVISLLKPIYERRKLLGAFNKILALEWKKMAERCIINPPFKPKVDREMTGFFGNHTIFDVRKLLGAGFALKWPDFREGMKDVARWYIENGWVPRH
jgi:UDP-glucose 4-epimerase